MAATGSTATVREAKARLRLPATSGTSTGFVGVGTLIEPVSVRVPVFVRTAGDSTAFSPPSLLKTRLAIWFVKVLRSKRPAPLMVTVAVGATWSLRRSWVTDCAADRPPPVVTPPFTTRLPGTA